MLRFADYEIGYCIGLGYLVTYPFVTRTWLSW